MGVANRTDFDLNNHIEASGKDLRYFDQAANERYVRTSSSRRSA